MEADAASVPQEWNSRNVRACVACHLIKTFDQVSQTEAAVNGGRQHRAFLCVSVSLLCLHSRRTLANRANGGEILTAPSLPPRTIRPFSLLPHHGNDKFYDAGCENCAFLDMEQNKDRVLEATTTNFSGMCASTDPEGSWVSRWVGTSTMVPGVYAVQATATEMSEELEQLLEANGVQLKE